IRVSAGALTLSLARATGQPSAGGLAITEGPQAAPVALGEAQDWRLRPDGLSYRRDEAAGGLAVAVAMRTAGTDAILVELALSNAGTRPRLLEVRWSAAVAGAGLTAWDGRDGRPATFPEYRGGDLSLRLPLSVAYHAGGGVAVGLDPSRPLSTFRNRFEPTADGGLAGFSTRLVVDPGAAVALPLCAFAFTPTFGHLDAVQRWYGLYPGCFTIHPEVRPSLIGGGGYLQSQQTTRELQWEEARRFGMTWEWAYCPAQTPGDWYADERFYDPEKGYAGPTDAHRNGPKGSLDDYRRDMRERFHRGWWATNLAYYMLPHAADETVLAAFPDGVVLDAKGQRHPKIVGWIKPDATTRMTYPWGNAYGQEVVREIEQITGDFGPAAIGFDEAYGGLRHYGPGIAGDPARAWDDEGKIYASTQVALAHLGDVIHRQRVRGYAVACVFNKPTSINTAVRCDIGMHEHPPYENVDAIGPLRLLLGHKPMSWWSPLKTWEVLDWQRLDAAQIRAGMQGMYAYVRLASLRYGAFPMGHQVRGVRSMVALMPVLSELLREGWQPTPAATAHVDLWLSRYGTGVETFLVAGNPKRSQRPGELRVIESYLEGQTLFADYHGGPLTVRSADGVSTPDLSPLDGHQHRLARALVQVVSDTPAALRGSAAMDWQPLARGTVRGSWQAARDRVGTLRV
ncbi:MAG: hypothetical protein GX595_14985, partial [Lentisphaerae bacterium]|nr:hypothetical protein [Lentisphaerota bacterium]